MDIINEPKVNRPPESNENAFSVFSQCQRISKNLDFFGTILGPNGGTKK